MLVLTRKNRESVVIGRPDEMQVVLEITILEIEGGRVRLGFEADTRMPIHRREVWDRICNGEVTHNGAASNGAASNGAASNGAASNGAASNGAAARGSTAAATRTEARDRSGD